VTFQGTLHDLDGNPVSGLKTITFTLYPRQNSVANVWQEQQAIEVIDGFYVAALGAETPFQDGLFAEAELWLGVRVGDDDEMTPRTRILAVPYALYSKHAEVADRAKNVDAATVGTVELIDGSVTTGKLANESVTSAKLAANAASTAKIADGAVVQAKLGNASVGSAQLQDGSITAQKLATEAVSTPALGQGSVSTEKLADDAVTGVKIASGSVSSDELAEGAVQAVHISDNAVETAALKSGAVTADKLALSAVETDAIKDGAVTGPKLAAEAVGNAALAPDAVGTLKISDGAVTGAKLAEDSVGRAHIVNGAVTQNKLADQSLYPEKVGAGYGLVPSGASVLAATRQDTEFASAGLSFLKEVEITSPGAWAPIDWANATGPRIQAAVAFTGSEVIIVGGQRWWGNYPGTGKRYALGSGRWSDMADPPSAHITGHCWADDRLLIWYGSGGASYSPETDSWASISATGAPSPRVPDAAVWSGTELFIIRGRSGTTQLNDAYAYNPQSDSWRQVSNSMTSGTPPILWHNDALTEVSTTGVRRFDENAQKWSDPSLITPALTTLISAVIIGDKVCIYGTQGISGELFTAEVVARLNQDQTWTTWRLPYVPLAESYKNAFMVGIGNQLFIGSAGRFILFNPATEEWSLVSPSIELPPSSYTAALDLGGRLFLYGALDFTGSGGDPDFWQGLIYDPGNHRKRHHLYQKD
jgi:hypothetical protein